jgi:hypothetical protein
MKLIEMFTLREELNDQEAEDIMLLMHDKELVGGDYSARMPALEKAIAIHGEPCPPLYRGLPPGRGNGTIKNGLMSFRGYASFSELRDVALRFSQQTNTLVELTGQHRGFCFYKWIEAEYRAMDPETFESADGESMIELAREEAEWILPFKSSFRVVNDRREGSLRIITVT